ncbi:UvrD-helicase domain-containing protein [Geopseudomonas aromaticivorans]
MQWTAEQFPAITSLARLIKIQAFAGTGKTTTLVGYSEQHANERILYLCYNKSVEVAAKGRFPRNVVCKTAHGLAYGQVGAQYKHKLTNNLRVMDIAKVANTQHWELAWDILGTLNNFMASADPFIDQQHFPRFKDLAQLTSRHQQAINAAVDKARDIWSMMIDVNNTAVQISHDGYLKLWAMREPNLSSKFDTVLGDEAQDINPVIAQIIRTQAQHGVKVVVCGDGHQMLYRFRGAVDALNSPWLAGAEVHYLTQSFRFGPAVAHVANILLALKGETVQLQGLGEATQVKRQLPDDLPHRAFLHRTVTGVLENALRLIDDPKTRLFWVGGIDSYSLRELEDLFWFSRGQNDKVQGRKLLVDYASFEQYEEIADATQENEMVRSVKIIKAYKNLPDRIKHLRARTTTDELESTVTLTTVHKAKGLEWDFVKLWDDFNTDVLDAELDAGIRVDEINLLYVAVTRAMKILALNSNVLAVMQDYVDRRDGKKPDPARKVA